MQANNYAMLFEKYLLNDNEGKKLKINLADFKESKDMGYFVVAEKRILINNKIKPEQIEHVLCHEFIHFLIMAERPYIENEKGEFEQIEFRPLKMFAQYGTFLNEAVTEFINSEINTNSRLYTYHVRMLKFMQSIFGNQNNLVAYLRGYIPQDEHELFEEFKTFANKFQNNSKIKGVSHQVVSQDENFIGALNTLNKMFLDIMTKEIESGKINSVMDYIKRVYGVIKSQPIETKDFDNVMAEINNKFLSIYITSSLSPVRKKLYLEKLANCFSNYNKYVSGIIVQHKIPLNFSTLEFEIYNDKIGVVFGNGTKYFSREDFNNSKIISFQSCNEKGEECEVDMMLNIYQESIEIRLSEPYNKEYVFDCEAKKMKYIEINNFINLKNDIKFLEEKKEYHQNVLLTKEIMA